MKWLFAALLTVVCWWERARLRFKRILCSVRATTIAFLEQVVGSPSYLLGHSDGAIVALLTALERPDFVRKLVFSSGVFHHDGWAPGAIDLDEETLAFFIDYWGAVAPDGREHFWVVNEKLDRMHREEQTLTVADLAGYPGPALIMVGDSDEEIPMEHTTRSSARWSPEHAPASLTSRPGAEKCILAKASCSPRMTLATRPPMPGPQLFWTISYSPSTRASPSAPSTMLS